MVEDGMDESFKERLCSVLQTHEQVTGGKAIQVTEEISG